MNPQFLCTGKHFDVEADDLGVVLATGRGEIEIEWRDVDMLVDRLRLAQEWRAAQLAGASNTTLDKLSPG